MPKKTLNNDYFPTWKNSNIKTDGEKMDVGSTFKEISSSPPSTYDEKKEMVIIVTIPKWINTDAKYELCNHIRSLCTLVTGRKNDGTDIIDVYMKEGDA